MTLFIFLTAGLFLLSLVWNVTDPRGLTDRIKSYFTFQAIGIVLAQIILVVMTYLSITFLPWPSTPIDPVLLFLGVGIYISGITLSILAKLEMKKSWGMPGKHEFHRQNKLITNGIYSFSRNPIYLGLFLTYLGYGLALRSYAIIFAFLKLGYYWYSIKNEERLLEHFFNQSYLEYKKKVRRFI